MTGGAGMQEKKEETPSDEENLLITRRMKNAFTRLPIC